MQSKSQYESKQAELDKQQEIIKEQEHPGKGRSRLKKARIRRPGTISHINSICKFRNYFPGFLPRQSANFQQNIHCTCFQEAKKRDREKKLRKNLVRSRGGVSLHPENTPARTAGLHIYKYRKFSEIYSTMSCIV